jgi:hypothetical protein
MMVGTMIRMRERLARFFLAALERPAKAGVVEACEGRERHRRVDARQCIRGPRR